MFDTDFEYRIVYQWDRDHWTCIFVGDIPTDIYHYLSSNLAEMQDAMEDSEDAYFSVEHRYGNELLQVWQGTPEELLKAFKEITDEWLSHAFE